jgi:hypothetical protein
VIYSLWVDDLASGRDRAREALDEVLARPLDSKVAAEQERQAALASNDPEWGLTPDAVEAAELADQFFAMEE